MSRRDPFGGMVAMYGAPSMPDDDPKQPPDFGRTFAALLPGGTRRLRLATSVPPVGPPLLKVTLDGRLIAEIAITDLATFRLEADV